MLRIFFVEGDFLKKVGDTDPVDRFGGMSHEPRDDVGGHSLLSQDIPKRLALTSGARRRTHSLAIRHRFGEPMDSVFIRPFPGPDRIPEHRAQDGLERSEISPGSPIKKSPHVRHCPLGEVFVDEFPVGGVPPDQ